MAVGSTVGSVATGTAVGGTEVAVGGTAVGMGIGVGTGVAVGSSTGAVVAIGVGSAVGSVGTMARKVGAVPPPVQAVANAIIAMMEQRA